MNMFDQELLLQNVSLLSYKISSMRCFFSLNISNEIVANYKQTSTKYQHIDYYLNIPQHTHTYNIRNCQQRYLRHTGQNNKIKIIPPKQQVTKFLRYHTAPCVMIEEEMIKQKHSYLSLKNLGILEEYREHLDEQLEHHYGYSTRKLIDHNIGYHYYISLLHPDEIINLSTSQKVKNSDEESEHQNQKRLYMHDEDQ